MFAWFRVLPLDISYVIVENELVHASSSFPATIIIIIVLCILELWHVTQRSNIVGLRSSIQFDVLTHRGVVLEITLTTAVVSIIESLLDNTKVIWYMYYINSTYLVVNIHLTVGRYYCILVYIASSIRK